MVDKQKRADQLRAKKQAYPKFQLAMERDQLKLNRAATMVNMKAVGKYNVAINQLWAKHYKEWHI